MLTINLNDIHTDAVTGTVTMASSWDELTEKQFLRVAWALMEAQGDDLTTDTLLVMAALNLSDRKIRKLLPAAAIMQKLHPEVQWMKQPCDCTVQKLAVISKRCRSFYGPATDIENLSMVEFDFAERALWNWHQDTGNISLLWDFVATIYRPRQLVTYIRPYSKGDVRVAFNDNTIARRAAWMQKHLPGAYAYAVLFWYKACRQKLMQLYPLIFQPNIEQADATTGGAPSYFKIIKMIAEKGTFGTFKDVENEWLCNILGVLEETIIEARTREELNKQD